MWTIVQHSGFGYAANPQFKQGLEERMVTTKAAQRKVREAGGLLFDDYVAASEFCEAEMYRDDESWNLIPHAAGTFSTKHIDGLAIYIPARKELQA